MAKYIELIDKYRIVQSEDTDYNTPSYDWVDNTGKIVRCKDCEYCRRADEFEYWCDGFCSPARLVRKDDFCSHGKAKE